MKLTDARILIIDDDADVLLALGMLMKQHFTDVITATNPEIIAQLVAQKPCDVVLLDMNFKASVHTGNEGLFWLRQLLSLDAQAKVIMLTAYGDVNMAVRSLKEGAADFILKPWDNHQLVSAVKEVITPKHSTDVTTLHSSMIGESMAMQNLWRTIQKIAPTDANILILGENGTGKDVVAKIIHELSTRHTKALIKVDVGAVPSTLFESEIFGYKKGAFTDARSDKTGLMVAAHGSTLFMDEIANIDLPQQAKLLTVLQNRVVVPLGSTVGIPIDVRVLCATNSPLLALTDETKFRKDLLYRINTITLHVPPLRDRGHDVWLLAQHFLTLYARKYARNDLQISDSAQQKLLRYSFPGNVRELQHMIERAVIMCDHHTIHDTDIVYNEIENPQGNEVAAHGTLEDIERSTIIRTIEQCNGNISKAAKELGLTRTALYRRLHKYNI